MKKLTITTFFCVLGLTLITAFTPVLPNNSANTGLNTDSLKVSWNIGNGGKMEYLKINDNLIVGDVTGTGYTYLT